jgi:hypothetical protein
MQKTHKTFDTELFQKYFDIFSIKVTLLENQNITLLFTHVSVLYMK